ncbi:MAG: hypothetical protein ABI591_09960 [Kofleriaceae bacterium]
MTKKLLIPMVLFAHAAAAQPNDTATSAAKRGQAALAAGRVHEACDAFATSENLEAKPETELSLADCLEQDGKHMAAARLYRELADRDPNTDRRKTSAAKAAKLEAKAPRLRFAIHPNPPGLVIKVDGVEVPIAGDVQVDVGPHEVTATAPGFTGHASAPADRDNQIVDVIVRMQPVEQAAPAPAPAPVAAPAEPSTSVAPAPAPMTMSMPMSDTEANHDHRKRDGVIVGAVGLGVLAGAVVMYSLSSGKFDDEHTLCPSSMCANAADLDHAHSLLDSGHAYRGVSIGMGIGGVLLVAVGAYRFLTPHHDEPRVSLQLDRTTAGAAYTVRF